MDLYTTLSDYGIIYLLCGYEGETLVIAVEPGFSLDTIWEKICARWSGLDRSFLDMHYSLPDFPRIVLAEETDFRSMIDLTISHGLVRITVDISNGVTSNNILANVVNDDEDVLSKLIPSHGKKLLTAGWEKEVSEAGQKFKGGAKELRIALLKTAIGGGFQFKWVRNDVSRVSATCADVKCSWFVHASVERVNDFFYVIEINNVHTCGACFQTLKHTRVSSELVSLLILEDVRSNIDTSPASIKRIFERDYGLQITYKLAYLAVERAKKSVLGDIGDSFGDLESYVECCLRSNPGSHIILDVEKNSRRFKRMFVSFAACIKGFNFCRPMLFIDGTHLKGKFKGQLLGATAKDGDNGLYHVAYAVVDSENLDNWQWFMDNLKQILSLHRQVTFVSDRNPGLLDAVRKVFPGYPHGYCLNHLKRNLKHTFRGRSCSSKLRARLEWLLVQAAYAPTVDIFNHFRENFITDGGATAKEFIDNIDNTKWENAFFIGTRYGEMSSNAAESFNNWILAERNLPVTNLVDSIRIKLMRQICAREIIARQWTIDLCPSIAKKLKKSVVEGRQWMVTRSSEHIFEVHSDPSVEVRLDAWTCSCRHWQICSFPCSHVVACILQTDNPIPNFVHISYHADTYVKCYAFSIQPVPMFGLQKDANEDPIIPPSTKRPPGRPKEKRILSQGEHIPRKMKCSRCLKTGNHNKKSCKEPLA